jgi:hypothetical protein
VEDEGVVAIAGGRCLEACATTEAGELVLVTFLAEDLLLELVTRDPGESGEGTNADPMDVWDSHKAIACIAAFSKRA